MIMNTRQNRLIIFALLLLTQTPLGAQLHSTKIELPEDSISATMEDSIPAKRSFFKKFLDYFNDANKEKKNKKFDLSNPQNAKNFTLGICGKAKRELTEDSLCEVPMSMPLKTS